nr:head-tail connector protein [Ancylobacter pratisalsi]
MIETSEIVTLAELEAHLRVDDGEEDAGLSDMLEAARRHIEAWVGLLDDFEEVPADLVEALKQLAGHFYENREATSDGQATLSEVPFGFHDLIGPYRRWEF